MKPRSILTISLLVVITLAACAPTVAPAPVQPAAPVTVPPVEPSLLPTVTLPAVAATEAPPTEAPGEVSQPVATSRGPSLHATNPADVSLASGELQLVEFFRYT